MTYSSYVVIMGLFLLAGAMVGCRSSADVQYVLTHATIYTMNDEEPQAEAMAVGVDGRILAVGSQDAILKKYPSAPRVDAEGLTVIPGIIDAHAHLMGLGMSRLQVDLVGTRSLDEVIARLQERAASLPEGAWLLGRGWDQNDWPEKRFPTHEVLDRYFPDRPVWLRRIDGHAWWANKAAMRPIWDTLQHMPDPEGGKIVRDASGKPTGIFIDAAMQLINQLVPEPSREERKQALQLALKETVAFGLTGVHDAGVDQSTIELYQEAIDEGAFPLRVYAMIGGQGPTFEAYCGKGPFMYKDRLVVRSVKYYIDGALGSRGAALLEDYSDDPGNRGLLRYEPDVFTRMVREAMSCGFQVNTHAIGDRGNRVVLDAYEAAMQEVPDHAGRHRIEHAQVVTLEDIPRFARLGVIASMQPTHATSDMYWAEDRLGPERIKGAYAWRRFLDAGVRLAFGSDFPVESANPMLGIYAAVTRQDTTGWPPGGWYPDQRLTREEALRAFTLDAAYAAFQEHELGSLEPGKWADFLILDRDIMRVPEQDIFRTKVYATVLGGEVVFRHTASPVQWPQR